MSERSPRILIVRPSALGDVARTVPALVTLRNAFPGAHIDWLVHEAYVDVIRCHPALNGVVPFARGRFGRMLTQRGALGEFLAWSRGLRQGGYDIAVDLQGLFRSGVFTWLTRASRRIGFANAREGAALAYNRRHRIDAQMHTVDRMLALLEAEGLPPAHDMRLYVPDDDAQWLSRHTADLGWGDRPYLCLAPAARWRCKCWPLERYAELARRLADHPRCGGRVMVLASPSERQQIAPLLDSLGGDMQVSCPETTVGRMMAIISSAALVVCNDSGPLHVAVGFDIPIVAVFGPTLAGVVGPYRRDDAVVQVAGVTPEIAQQFRRRKDDQSLIARISVEQVYDMAVEQLRRIANVSA